MARNRNAGKHPSYLKLNWSPSSIARKRAYDKKYNASKEKINYRAELNQANRDAGTYGNGDKKDMSQLVCSTVKYPVCIRICFRSQHNFLNPMRWLTVSIRL